MLSNAEKGVKACYAKYSLPMLETPRFVRFKFIKTGSLQFISHLDLHRTINRAIIRAGIPAWYTQGFNPHTRLVFAAPLSVGLQSIAEYFDLRVNRVMSPEEMMERLNLQLPSGMRIVEAFYPTTSFALINWSEYELELYFDKETDLIKWQISTLFERSDIPVLKRTKSGEKDVNIRPMIRKMSYKQQGNCIKIRAVLSACSMDYLNPEMLIKAIVRHQPSVFGDELPRYRITRTKLLLADGITEFV